MTFAFEPSTLTPALSPGRGRMVVRLFETGNGRLIAWFGLTQRFFIPPIAFCGRTFIVRSIEFTEMSNSNDAQPWDIESARALYNIHRWGAKYFDINDAGHVVARPQQDAGVAVDLTDVIEEAKA